jgi:hypothetical protein
MALDAADLLLRTLSQRDGSCGNILNDAPKRHADILSAQNSTYFVRVRLTKVHFLAEYIEYDFGPRSFVVLTEFSRNLP